MADVQTEQTEAVAGPTIGLADLQNAIKIIDFACEQGAFKGWSVIEQVSLVRTKLAAFVEAASPKEAEADTDHDDGPVVEQPITE